MKVDSTRYLFYWACFGFALIAFVAVFPEILSKHAQQNDIWKVASAILAVVIGGFYLRMIWDCLSAQHDPRRFLWLAFLIFIPVISAYIYFFVTRSIYYAKNSGQR